MKAGTEGYTQIVIALIDQCFASDGAERQYNSILDVADLISLEQYKIVTSIEVYPTKNCFEPHKGERTTYVIEDVMDF